MAGAPITHFELDDDRLSVISECMENYDVGESDAEWPNNIISRRTVVYGSGVMAREGEQVRHAVDPDELATCRRLSEEAAVVMDGVEVGMGSNRSCYFRGFFIVANVDELAPSSITTDLIRAKFGGTLFPPVKITVEPLVERGTWWSEVKRDVSGVAKHLIPWRSMIDWFRNQSELGRVTVRQDREKPRTLACAKGKVSGGDCYPRLCIAKTVAWYHSWR